MKEINGDLWTNREPDSWRVITTNGFVKTNGCCVMGRGVAKQAASRWKELPATIGKLITDNGNQVYPLVAPYRLFTFPVKARWWDNAELSLIMTSAGQLLHYVNEMKIRNVYMPRPGCGNGNLQWDIVKPLLVNRLDDRFTVVELHG